ncbi:hypothetical protein BGX26_005678 [Mortierella sp. AD094]|nr:hypothetical protein BGX26_005678 [Mortierella sp. AD094]
MEDEMTDQEEFFAAIDASNHVYLLNFLLMTDPIHQMRKEREDLERQWIRLRNCKETFVERHSVDTFLNKYDILEYGFDDDFVERYNLSVVAHDTFMPQLDLERSQRGLEGYLKVFRLQLEENTCILREEGDSLWRSAVQLATIVMALYIRQGNELSSQNLNEMMEKSWSGGEREVEAVRFMHNIAPIAANDDDRLYGLYQDTLKLIQKQLQTRVDSIDEPSNVTLVKDLTTKRSFGLSEYDGYALQGLDTNWFKNPALLVGTTQHATTSQSQIPLCGMRPAHSPFDYSERTKITDEAPALIGVTDNPIFVDSTQTSEENNDEEGDLDVRRWIDRVFTPRSVHSQSMDLDDENGFSAESERQSSLLNSKEKVNDDSDMKEMERFQDKPVMSLPRLGTLTSKPTTADLRKSRASIRKPAGLIGRVKNAIGVRFSAEESSDSEFEDDGYVPPLEMKRKRPSTPPSALIQTPEHAQGDGDFAGEGSNSDPRPSLIPWSPSPIESVRSISPRPVRPAKVRRQNRAWTSAEVDRLMELADKFQRKPSVTGKRSWKMCWSQLKKFDERNGDILKHRTEVMLKDKYRERTDNGRHRQQVIDILRCKNSDIPRYQFPPHDGGLV